MISDNKTMIRERQLPLRKKYQNEPEAAHVIDRARTQNGPTFDPFHGEVALGTQGNEIVWPFGIHEKIGGDHDLPNPGDIMCAALAACLDSTIRAIAAHLGIVLENLTVEISAHGDVRGTLLVDNSVPVGFTELYCTIDVRAAEGTPERMVDMMLQMAEKCCIVYQTLQNPPPVKFHRLTAD